MYKETCSNSKAYMARTSGGERSSPRALTSTGQTLLTLAAEFLQFGHVLPTFKIT